MARLPLGFTSDRSGRGFFEGIASFAVIAGLLYLGAGILVPLVLAVLLAFALTPVVNWFGRRLHLPDAIAVILAVILAIAALGTFVFLAGTQVVKLAQELPGYQHTVLQKIAGLQQQFGGLAWLDQLNNTISTLSQQLSDPETPRPGAPLPVTISNNIGPIGILTSVMGSIIGPVATLAIVTVFLIFLLMGRGDLQERFIRLVSAGRYSLTNLAISDASQRVGRYLITQLLVNIVYGTIFGLGLWFIGVPSAPLWGLLIVLFRYIPFVGALIIAVVPFMLAFAVDPGWSMLVKSVALYLVLDLTTSNVIEPRLYGARTGVSPIAILLSALFWATLWGPVGLILATPMTVCLVVIGRHLPQFQFLETLLGSEPVLSHAERVYQRMLKGDAEDAIDLSEDYIEEHDKAQFTDEVMLPALHLANAELSDGPQSLPQRRQLVQSFDAVLEDVFDAKFPEQSEILLIGGRSEIDEAAAKLLALRLVDHGLTARVLPPAAIRQEAIGRLDLEGVEIVVLVFMGTDLRAQSRYVARRIRRMAPDIQIVVCALNEISDSESAESLHVDAYCTALKDAAELVEENQNAEERASLKAAGPGHRFSGAGRGNDALGLALEAIAEQFSVPVAAINLLDDERHQGDSDAWRLTQLVAEHRAPLIVQSDKPNALVGENAYLQTTGIDLYAGVPLVLGDGEVIGALTLLAYEPRAFLPADIERLTAAAAELVAVFGSA